MSEMEMKCKKLKWNYRYVKHKKSLLNKSCCVLFLMAGQWLETKLLVKTIHFLVYITYLTSTKQQVRLR